MSRRIHPRKQLGYSARHTTQDRWQFRVANGTPRPECKTFPDFEAGRLWAEQQVRLHQDGELASHKQAREFTLVQALKRYGEEVSIGKRGRTQELSRIKMLAALPLSRNGLATLRTEHFAQLKKTWMHEAGPNGRTPLLPSTWMKYYCLLHHLFEIARKEWGFPTLDNPLSRQSKPRLNNERNRRLTDDEYQLIVQEAQSRLQSCCDANPYFLYFFNFSIHCPQRRNELLTRKWADINWKERSLRIPNGKTGYRVAPILPEALKILGQMREQFKPVSPKERIFPMTANAVHMIWNDIKKKLNLENLHWHDLRHEGCSRAAKMLNFDIAKLQKVSGHKSLSQLIRYVNYNMNDVHEAVDKINQPVQEPSTHNINLTPQLLAESLNLLLENKRQNFTQGQTPTATTNNIPSIQPNTKDHSEPLRH